MLDFNTFGRRAKVGGSIRARAGEFLTDDQLRAVAPSIFATEAHESRSARFAPVATSMVLDGLRREGFQPVQAMQARSRIEGKAEYTKHMLRLRHQGDGHALAVGDKAFEIVLVNANDGTAAYHMAPGLFRLVCLNGLMVSEGSYDEVKVRHSGDAVGQVIEGAYRVLGESEEVMDQANRFSALALSPPERHIMAEAAHTLRFGDKEADAVPVTAADLLRPRRYADNGADLWMTMNVLQENVIRGGQSGRVTDANGRRRNASVRAVAGIDQNRSLNRALWTLAERMAELKAA